jgi:ParB family chromosome partitioning protein
VKLNVLRDVNIPCDKLVFNADYSFRLFSDGALEILADSIKRLGQLQPIVVRFIGDGKYEVIDGRNRLKAILLNGNKKIEAIIIEANDEMAIKLNRQLNIHAIIY